MRESYGYARVGRRGCVGPRTSLPLLLPLSLLTARSTRVHKPPTHLYPEGSFPAPLSLPSIAYNGIAGQGLALLFFSRGGFSHRPAESGSFLSMSTSRWVHLRVSAGSLRPVPPAAGSLERKRTLGFVWKDFFFFLRPQISFPPLLLFVC